MSKYYLLLEEVLFLSLPINHRIIDNVWCLCFLWLCILNAFNLFWSSCGCFFYPCAQCIAYESIFISFETGWLFSHLSCAFLINALEMLYFVTPPCLFLLVSILKWTPSFYFYLFRHFISEYDAIIVSIEFMYCFLPTP